MTTIGEPFWYHQEVLSLQPMFPTKSFDNFPPKGGCSEGLDAFRFFLNIIRGCTCTYFWLGELLTHSTHTAVPAMEQHYPTGEGHTPSTRDTVPNREGEFCEPPIRQARELSTNPAFLQTNTRPSPISSFAFLSSWTMISRENRNGTRNGLWNINSFASSLRAAMGPRVLYVPYPRPRPDALRANASYCTRGIFL